MCPGWFAAGRRSGRSHAAPAVSCDAARAGVRRRQVRSCAGARCRVGRFWCLHLHLATVGRTSALLFRPINRIVCASFLCQPPGQFHALVCICKGRFTLELHGHVLCHVPGWSSSRRPAVPCCPAPSPGTEARSHSSMAQALPASALQRTMLGRRWAGLRPLLAKLHRLCRFVGLVQHLWHDFITLTNLCNSLCHECRGVCRWLT